MTMPAEVHRLVTVMFSADRVLVYPGANKVGFARAQQDPIVVLEYPVADEFLGRNVVHCWDSARLIETTDAQIATLKASRTSLKKALGARSEKDLEVRIQDLMLIEEATDPGMVTIRRVDRAPDNTWIYSDPQVVGLRSSTELGAAILTLRQE